MVIAIPVVVAAALLAFLLMGGAYLLGKVLAAMFSQLPVVGSAVAGAVEAAVSWSVRTTWGLIAAAVGGLLNFVEAPFRAMWQFGDAVVAGFERTAGALATLAQTLGQAFTTATHYAQSLVQGLSAVVSQDVAALEQAIGSVLTTVTHYAQQLYNAAIAALTQSVAALEGAITATWNATTQAIAATQQWAAGLVQTTATALQRDVNAVGTAAAAETAALGRWATTAVHDVYDSLTSEIDKARADSIAYTEAAAAALSAYLGTTIAPAVTAVATEVDECLRPYCTGIKSVGGTLNRLATLVTITALLGFMAEAVADPGAAATQVNDVLAPVAEVMYQGIAAVVGLAT